jgi:ATP synthase protein I
MTSKHTLIDPPTSGSEPPSTPSEGDDLARRIQAAKVKTSPKARPSQADGGAPTGWGTALKMGGEFASAIIVGGFIGWWLDKALDWSPFMLVICLGLGFAAGVRNVVRAAARMAENAGRPDA